MSRYQRFTLNAMVKELQLIRFQLGAMPMCRCNRPHEKLYYLPGSVMIPTLVVLTLALMSHAARAEPLYFNSFDTEGLPNGPFISGSASFDLDAPNSEIDYLASGNGAVVIATATANVSSHPGFVVSSRFTLNESTVGGSTSSIGFGALGSSADFSLGGYYLADWASTPDANVNAAGRLRIIELGDPAHTSFSATNGNTGGSESIVAAAIYELRLTGVYGHDGIDPTLEMTLEMFDEQGSLLGTAATAVVANPPLAEYFGFRNRTGSSSQTVSASFDYFSIEPYVEPPPSTPGDFNSDGNVDGADFVIWQTNFPNNTGEATLETGDANGDGNVDGADFVVWQTNFPTTAGSGVSQVPEPGAWSLAMMAGFGIGAWGWRRRSIG